MIEYKIAAQPTTTQTQQWVHVEVDDEWHPVPLSVGVPLKDKRIKAYRNVTRSIIAFAVEVDSKEEAEQIIAAALTKELRANGREVKEFTGAQRAQEGGE